MQLDATVGQLLSEHVTSYEQLETLLLLHAHSERTWTVAQVAEHIRIDDANVALALMELCSHQLLERDAGRPVIEYHYNPANGLLAKAVDLLATAYRDQRLEIVRLMSANAIERMRSTAARTFSDAFLLKGKKE